MSDRMADKAPTVRHGDGMRRLVALQANMAASLANYPITQAAEHFDQLFAVDVARQLHAASTSSFT